MSPVYSRKWGLVKSGSSRQSQASDDVQYETNFVFLTFISNDQALDLRVMPHLDSRLATLLPQSVSCAAVQLNPGHCLTLASELCRKLLRALRTTTGAAATYQSALVELESLARILREVESLKPTDQDDDHRRIDSLRAVALAAMYPIRNFSQELQKYEAALFPSATSKATRVKKMGRAMQWTMNMDEEVRKFQLYISGQLLSITTLLQLRER